MANPGGMTDVPIVTLLSWRKAIRMIRPLVTHGLQSGVHSRVSPHLQLPELQRASVNPCGHIGIPGGAAIPVDEEIDEEIEEKQNS